MKISVITSLYKCKKYLPGFLNHLSKVDNLTECEFIFVHNLPSEDELIIINKFILEHPNIRIKHIKLDFLETLYASWNRGILNSNGETITFWNVDDVRFSNAIIYAYEKIKYNNIDVVYFPFIIKKRHKYFKYIPIYYYRIDFSHEYNREFFRTGMMCGPFFMVKRNAFERIGLFDEQFKIVGDMEWCVRAADKNLKFKRIMKIAGIFVRNGDTLSGTNADLQTVENEVVYRRYNIKWKYQNLNKIQKETIKKYNI